ncbi:MAG: hypothetical protein R2843_16025 [Thermomicrobiales bacterium]
MKEQRFDALTRAFGRRTSRRTTIGIGTAGIAGAALHILEPGRALAQQATPEVAPDISFPMVQTAGATTLAPVSGADHTLTLTGISAQTLFFSDCPARVAATVPTADFIEAWAQIGDNPPNATLIAHREVGDATDVAVVVTLTAPSFDDASGTLTYNARILDAGANRRPRIRRGATGVDRCGAGIRRSTPVHRRCADMRHVCGVHYLVIRPCSSDLWSDRWLRL